MRQSIFNPPVLSKIDSSRMLIEIGLATLILGVIFLVLSSK